MSKLGPSEMGRHLAVLAHRAAIEEMAQLQRDMLLQEMLNQKFTDALPVREFVRRIHTRHQVYTDQKETQKDDLRRMQNRASELRAILIELETVFRKYYDAENKEFARAMAEHFKRRSGK